MTVLVAKVLAAVASIGSAIHPAPRELDPPMSTAVASWYAEDGVGACDVGDGVQSGLRFASLILACGTRIQVCHAGCAVGTMADHGPYVTGRTFDLNANLRAAIGCPDLCTVRWRVLP